MSDENHQDSLKIRQRSDGVIVVEGELNHLNIEAFQRTFNALHIEPNGENVFAMLGFEVNDGIAVVTVINVLRELLKVASKLKLIGAPQILCHNIYRAGMLDTGNGIELIDMREDEPYG